TENHQLKTYAVARVKRAVMSDDEYTSKGFDFDHFHKDSLAVYREGEIAKVEINIKEPIASYISERQWHPSQRSVRTASGVRLTLEVRVNDELVRWILGMGSNAEVVGPQALRDRMSEEISRLSGAYTKRAS
ncbi:MAG: WYL domain-containing protein, partial [Bdellovibrionales bacterium]|nr:WYL domain-containing protein [Bdellovibrionales bacterium]